MGPVYKSYKVAPSFVLDGSFVLYLQIVAPVDVNMLQGAEHWPDTSTTCKLAGHTGWDQFKLVTYELLR